MRYLLDTNALLVGGLAFETLKPSYQRILTNPNNELMLSPASIWEMAIKVRLGKLNLQNTTLDELAGEFRRRLKIKLLSIKQSHLLSIALLPKVKGHGDPFDLLIIAQALNEKLPVLTSDGEFHQYGVTVVK